MLYFSIHRYEHGNFWPSLKSGSHTFIGEGNGKGYNVNVPLNKVIKEFLGSLEIEHCVGHVIITCFIGFRLA